MSTPSNRGTGTSTSHRNDTITTGRVAAATEDPGYDADIEKSHKKGGSKRSTSANAGLLWESNGPRVREWTGERASERGKEVETGREVEHHAYSDADEDLDAEATRRFQVKKTCAYT